MTYPLLSGMMNLLSDSPASAEISADNHDVGRTGFYVVTADAGIGSVAAGLREFWAYREVMVAFATRVIRVKYKQAAIGVAWVVLQPLIATLLFTIVLGHLAHVSSEGAPYLLFALAGMVAWQFFSGALTLAADSVVADSGLLRKVYFPREVLPAAAVFASLADFAPGLALLLVVATAYGRLPALEWLALPVIPVVLVVGVLAYSLLPAALNVFYRDVRYLLPFVVQLGLFASPVIYSLGRIGQPWRDVFTVVNPAACAIDGLRRIVLHHEWPQGLLTAGCLAWSLFVALLAYVAFKKLERSFADRA